MPAKEKKIAKSLPASVVGQRSPYPTVRINEKRELDAISMKAKEETKKIQCILLTGGESNYSEVKCIGDGPPLKDSGEGDDAGQ